MVNELRNGPELFPALRTPGDHDSATGQVQSNLADGIA
jgi:hypothetical protein